MKITCPNQGCLKKIEITPGIGWTDEMDPCVVIKCPYCGTQFPLKPGRNFLKKARSQLEKNPKRKGVKYE
jgi:hypothetical protein